MFVLDLVRTINCTETSDAGPANLAWRPIAACCHLANLMTHPEALLCAVYAEDFMTTVVIRRCCQQRYKQVTNTTSRRLLVTSFSLPFSELSLVGLALDLVD